MGRSPCCSNADVNKGPWLQEESKILAEFVQKNGPGNWQTLPKKAGLNRCGKSCRLKWMNYLRPDIKREPFSEQEEAIIISLHEKYGNKWAKIAAKLPGRTDNAIKNYWNTRLKKKQELGSGIDQRTHLQISDLNLLPDQILQLNSNQFSLVNPPDPTLSFQRNATEMMTNFQFLQRLVLQALSSPLLYLQPISQVYGLVNGTNTQYIGSNFIQPQNTVADLHGLTPPPNELLASTSNSLQGAHGYSSFTNTCNSEHSLPSLVSEIPESSNFNPLESTPTLVFESDIFDTWDSLIDDEAKSTFLKDILG